MCSQTREMTFHLSFLIYITSQIDQLFSNIKEKTLILFTIRTGQDVEFLRTNVLIIQENVSIEQRNGILCSMNAVTIK